MQHAVDGDISATPYSHTSAKRKYTFNTPNWMRMVAQSIRKTLSPPSDEQELPRSNTPLGKSGVSKKKTTDDPMKTLHLLACVHETQQGTHLVQDRLEEMESDRELFNFIREQLSCTRSNRWKLFHLRTVIGIHFTKVKEWFAGFMDRADHISVSPPLGRLDGDSSSFTLLHTPSLRVCSFRQRGVRLLAYSTYQSGPACVVFAHAALAEPSFNHQAGGEVYTQSAAQAQVRTTAGHW